MHPNPAFRSTPDARNIAFVRDRAFGTLILNGDPVPLTAHIPFLLDKDGSNAELHLVRSNPIVRQLSEGKPAVITCTGPDGYVSPDWYGIDDQVPTWNYVSVRLTGTLEKRPQDELHALLDRLSAHFEDPLDKPSWTSGKMGEGVMERMMRMIVPFIFHVDTIEGTWKLNQNKDDPVRLAAAGHITQSHGQQLDDLAKLMIEAN